MRRTGPWPFIMKLGTIQGSATTSGYENWIVLESFQWGFAAGYTAKQPAPRFRCARWCSPCGRKRPRPLIVNAGVSRTVLPNATLKLTTTAKDKVDTFMTYEFANCVITNYAIRRPEKALRPRPLAQLHQGHRDIQSARFQADRFPDHRHLRRDDRPRRRSDPAAHRAATAPDRAASMQRQGPSWARGEASRDPGFPPPAGADGLAQGDMGARQVPPVRLGSQHLQALQEAGSGGMAIAGGRIVILHRDMILKGNDLTIS